MIEYPDIEQGTDAWIALRTGIPTASGSILTPKNKTRSKSSQPAGYYWTNLLAERLTGRPVKGMEQGNRWTIHGHENEPRARAWANHKCGPFRQVGFCTDDEGKYGASPDGLHVDKPEGLELKCPLKDVEQLKRLVNPKTFEDEHALQCHFGMMVTGYEVWWLISWHAIYPPLVLKIERDEALIERLKEATLDMVETLATHEKRIREMDRYGKLDHLKDENPDLYGAVQVFGEEALADAS